MPLCLGGGLPQLYAVMTLGKRLGARTVAVTAFTKLLCLGISQGFGFIGGPLFPIIFTGACTGSLIHIIFPGIPVIISFSCGFAAAPVVIIPGKHSLLVHDMYANKQYTLSSHFIYPCSHRYIHINSTDKLHVPIGRGCNIGCIHLVCRVIHYSLWNGLVSRFYNEGHES